MNKQCKACGTLVPNEARFCQNCGSSDLLVFEPDQTSVLDSNYNQYNTVPPVANTNNQYNFVPPVVNTNNQYNAVPPVANQTNQYQNYQQAPQMQPNWQAPVQQAQPKKKKTGLIIGIIAGVLAFLVVIGIIIGVVASQDSGYEDDYYGDFETVEYTKGYFDGTTYINEWADISFDIPEGFYEADYETYSSMENETTECGSYFIAEDNSSLIMICFEKLPAFPEYNESSYLDVAMSNLENEMDVYYLYDEYGYKTIAGYEYTNVVFSFDSGYGEITESIYVRQIDDYMVFISAISLDEETNDTLVDMIGNAY